MVKGSRCHLWVVLGPCCHLHVCCHRLAVCRCCVFWSCPRFMSVSWHRGAALSLCRVIIIVPVLAMSSLSHIFSPSLLFVGGHLHLWAVVFIFWLVVVTGRSWVVVGVRCHVVVAVGSVVGLCSWLVEERSDVTSCDISVMFKLAHEITWTISHDFLTVYTQSC